MPANICEKGVAGGLTALSKGVPRSLEWRIWVLTPRPSVMSFIITSQACRGDSPKRSLSNSRTWTFGFVNAILITPGEWVDGYCG